MSHHLSLASLQAPLSTYANSVNQTLDLFKHGDLSFEQARAREHASASLLLESLRSAFVVRLRNVEAVTTPASELPPAGGR